MHLVSSVITFVGIFMLMVCIGVYLKHLKIFAEDSAGTFSKLIMEVAYPAVIFTSVASAHIDRNIALSAVAFDIALLGAGLIAYCFTKFILKFEQRSLAAVVLAAMFSGTSLVGTAMLRVVYETHPEDVAIGVVITALSNGFLLNSLGVFIGARFGSDNQSGLKQQIKDFLYSKPILALFLGLLWNFLALPVSGGGFSILMGTLALIGASLPFLAAVITGLTFSIPKLKGSWYAIGLVAVCQLVVQPLAFHQIVVSFDLPGTFQEIGDLITSLAASPVIVAICNRYRCNTHLASVLVVSTMILSAVTLPISTYLVSI